jgi:hypothetical protein
MNPFMKTAIANLAEAPKMYDTENDISLKRRSNLTRHGQVAVVR